MWICVFPSAAFMCSCIWLIQIFEQTFSSDPCAPCCVFISHCGGRESCSVQQQLPSSPAGIHSGLFVDVEAGNSKWQLDVNVLATVEEADAACTMSRCIKRKKIVGIDSSVCCFCHVHSLLHLHSHLHNNNGGGACSWKQVAIIFQQTLNF